MPICAPKSDNEFRECCCTGKTLDRLVQPAILSILADEDLHGYAIVQLLAESPMFGGQKPDATGVYRSLRQMEELGYVDSVWNTSESGPAKKLFHLTDSGCACMARWVDTLTCYRAAVGELISMLRTAQAKNQVVAAD
ncbi:MAG: PadR family transcriptional regulator [Coriobacteriia bacterium]|nr:PadR family transcriptional regulator [Coriobacteriia bacterium]